jgi:hypothetical protein
MKNIFLLILVVACITSTTSCITSLQPIATPGKMVTDNRLTGQWMHEGTIITIESLAKSNFPKELLEDIMKNKDEYAKAYAVSFDEKGISYHMIARLVNLNGNLFLDLYPGLLNNTKAPDKDDPYFLNTNYLPGFTFARVEIGKDKMDVKFIDGHFIRKQVLKGRMRLKHESNEMFGTFMITASTEELQLFLQKYAADKRLFPEESTMHLQRQPPTT